MAMPVPNPMFRRKQWCSSFILLRIKDVMPFTYFRPIFSPPLFCLVFREMFSTVKEHKTLQNNQTQNFLSENCIHPVEENQQMWKAYWSIVIQEGSVMEFNCVGFLHILNSKRGYKYIPKANTLEFIAAIGQGWQGYVHSWFILYHRFWLFSFSFSSMRNGFWIAIYFASGRYHAGCMAFIGEQVLNVWGETGIDVGILPCRK